MRIPGTGVLLLAWLGSCAEGDHEPSHQSDLAGEEQCRTLQQPTELPAEIRESSGVAVSRRHPGVFWTHNDSGNEPEIFAINSAGKLLAQVRVTGARNQDWEDIALGPCPAGQCLYIGDIGDSRGKGDDLVIYRVPEPNPRSRATAQAERFRVRFPDGPRDAEALFVLPSGELYIISKERQAALYRYPLPLRARQTVTLERVRELDVGSDDRVTGADATPDGKWVAVRTNSLLALYRTPELLRGSGSASFRMDLAPLGEIQGEGVAIGADGTVVLTSEGGSKRAPGTLARLACTLR